MYESHFVFISSNAVYDGTKAPYGEYAIQNPINRYGWTKKDAEDMVDDYAFRSTIIRPIMLYGWPTAGRRPNFVTRIITDLEAGRPVPVAQDIYTQPTYAWDCAEAIWSLTKNTDKAARVVNIAPREKMSLYKFACEVALTFEHDPKKVIPVNAADLPGMATRPLDTTYDVARLTRLGLTMKPPIHGLLNMKKERP
jgi:dTDP-4-dehydrorhamnose reductase